MGEKITSRDELVELLLNWIRPVMSNFSKEYSTVKLGNTAAHYPEASARMEGFSRILWALGPLMSEACNDLPDKLLKERKAWCKIAKAGIVNGTNPESEGYWGEVWDYDQKMVEMAAIVTALLVAPEALWNPLTPKEQSNIHDWLDQINHKKVHANNWRFFRILVNVLFTVRNLNPNEEMLREDLAVIENCYNDGGWYYDGKPAQVDYYVPFAFHYYGLIYAKFMSEHEPDRCEIFKRRAKEFFKDYMYWFNEDGISVPYGRSLTYRFAHSAFFAAYALTLPNEDMSVAKHLALGNLSYWSGMPIFDNGGALTIGYGYPNLIMSEIYNAPGSPYWGFKTFLLLALPKNHPFWTAESHKPIFERQRLIKNAGMISAHSDAEAFLYPVGMHCMEHGQIAAKYEKFVYSSHHAFSVSRGNTLETGAFDNTLAVSRAGENFYRMRYGIDTCEISETSTVSSYTIGDMAHIETEIIPLESGNLRIHKLKALCDIELADGGFAHDKEKPMGTTECLKVITLLGNKHPHYELKDIIASPNTNLIMNRTKIPMMWFEFSQGEYIVMDVFFTKEGIKTDTKFANECLCKFLQKRFINL